MAIGWSESEVKRDAKGRFSRFEAGAIPDTNYLPDNLIDHILPNAFPNDLSEEEFNALDLYKQSWFGPINRGLRGGFVPSPMNETAEQIDGILARHSLPEDLWVSRATSTDAFGGKRPDELVGSTFVDDAFMSTTASENLPGDFDNPDSGYHVILRLKVPQGTPAYYTEGVGAMPESEHEVLLGRGRTIDVRGVGQRSDGRWEVFGEVRPDSD